MIYALIICVLVLYISGYSSICELARLIQKQNPVYVCHHPLLINTKIALVPSMPLSHCLARLLGRTAEGYKDQSTQEDKQNHFTGKKISFFHHFFPF
jgi:hypothetical protein